MDCDDGDGLCQVCGAKKVAKYFGVDSCDPCRLFFKGKDGLEVESKCDGKCPVTKVNRKCRACRMAKCLKVGMSLSKSHHAARFAATQTETSSTPTQAPSAVSKAKKTPASSAKSKLSLKGSKKNVAGTPNTLDSWAKDDATSDGPKHREDTNTTLTAQETDVEEEAKIPSVAALHNLGNTCFLNSVVQVLRYTPTFEEKVSALAVEIRKTEKERCQLLQVKQAGGDNFLKEDVDLDTEILTWELVKCLNGVFRKMGVAEEKYMNGQSNFIAIRPYDLLDTIERLNPMFQGNQQQDAHEFLRCIVAYIQDASRELNKFRQTVSGGSDTCSAASDGTKVFSSPIEVPLLGGCKDDGKVTARKDPSSAKSGDEQKLLKTKTRSSQRLSGGNTPASVEAVNAPLKNEPLPNGMDSPKKKQTKKRRSLSELQNNGIPGQKSIMDCLMKQSVKSEPLTSTDSDVENKVSPKSSPPAVNGGTKPVDKQHSASRLSMKRKAQSSESDSPAEKESLDTKQDNIPEKPADDVCLNLSKSLRKRRRCSPEKRGEEEVEKMDTVDVKTELETTSECSLSACSSVSPAVSSLGCSNSQSKNTSNETAVNESSVSSLDLLMECDEDPMPPGNIVAKVKPKITAEKKQTARKSAGGQKVESPGQESQESCRKGAVVKLNKHDISKYFAKTIRATSLSDVERHLEAVDDCIEGLFQGNVALQTRCCECETVTERREEYQDISVAIPQPQDEEEEQVAPPAGDENQQDKPGEDGRPTKDCVIVESIRKPSVLDEVEWVKDSLGEVERLQDDNKYLCDKCCHLVEAERSMHYLSVPGVLTLHLKRFAMNQGMMGTFTKLTAHVPLPLILPCIEDNCTDPSNHRLQLYGVVAHTGFTLTCGHYTAYVRAPSYHPALFDPDIVEQRPTKAVTTVQNGQLSLEADPNNNQDSNNNIEAGNSGACENMEGDSSRAALQDDKEPVYWFECDDEVITVLREDEFLAKVAPGHSTTNTPYLLFYQKVHVEN